MNDILFWLWGPSLLLIVAGAALWINRTPKNDDEPDLFDQQRPRVMANTEGLSRPTKVQRRR